MTPADILTLHHLRKTPARLAIVNSLQESSLPQSENDIHEKMQKSYDRITFYRTIQALIDSGVIHRIVADNTTVRYALNHCSIKHHFHDIDHVHFFCTRCGRVECLSGVNIQPYTLPHGYSEEECSVVIKGICKQCSAKTNTD